MSHKGEVDVERTFKEQLLSIVENLGYLIKWARTL